MHIYNFLQTHLQK